jgi:formylglycine-generating enzyme required for sulfatase activity
LNTRILFTTLILSAAGFAAHAQAPGTGFRDCNVCPDMVVVPAGSYIMGSPNSEEGRYPNESPQHAVTIPRAFAAGKFEVTRGQFAAFVNETAFQPQGDNCYYWDGGESKYVNNDPSKSWRNPGYTQSDGHPVVCVSWSDAKAYVAWLTQKTGKAYRLLTEAEWEYAARGGTTTARPWGNDPHQACAYANVGDLARNRTVSPGKGKHWSMNTTHNCDDNAGFTASVGSYRPNAYGLYDMIGNVWELTEDCWNDTYAGAPADGSAWLVGDCSRRAARGGRWYSTARDARSARRSWGGAALRNGDFGFRVARTL